MIQQNFTEAFEELISNRTKNLPLFVKKRINENIQASNLADKRDNESTK